MYKPLVSIIIPTYRRATFLSKAIKSCLNQTYKNLEIIVVDDNFENSIYREKTMQIIYQFSSINNIKYIKHATNKNGAAARNTGIRLSKGKYIAFLDDDDCFYREKIELQVKKLLASDNDVFGNYCGFEKFHNNKFKYCCVPYKKGNLSSDVLSFESFILGGSTLMVKQDFLQKVKGFDESFNRYQDLEFLLRLFQIGKIEVVSKVLVRINTDSNENRLNIEKLVESNRLFFKRFSKIINSLSNKDRKKVKKSMFYSLAKISLYNHEYVEFFKTIFKGKILLFFLKRIMKEIYQKKLRKKIIWGKKSK